LPHIADHGGALTLWPRAGANPARYAGAPRITLPKGGRRGDGQGLLKDMRYSN